jgi:hypothetical protein
MMRFKNKEQGFLILELKVLHFKNPRSLFDILKSFLTHPQ